MKITWSWIQNFPKWVSTQVTVLGWFLGPPFLPGTLRTPRANCITKCGGFRVCTSSTPFSGALPRNARGPTAVLCRSPCAPVYTSPTTVLDIGNEGPQDSTHPVFSDAPDLGTSSAAPPPPPPPPLGLPTSVPYRRNPHIPVVQCGNVEHNPGPTSPAPPMSPGH